MDRKNVCIQDFEEKFGWCLQLLKNVYNYWVAYFSQLIQLFEYNFLKSLFFFLVIIYQNLTKMCVSLKYKVSKTSSPNGY